MSYRMAEDDAIAIFGAVNAYVEIEAEVRFLDEIGEPATAEVGNRYAARAKGLKDLLTREAKRRAEARLGAAGVEVVG